MVMVGVIKKYFIFMIISYIILILRSEKLTLAGEVDLIILIRFNDNADHLDIH